jgi:hypothetical protein
MAETIKAGRTTDCPFQRAVPSIEFSASGETAQGGFPLNHRLGIVLANAKTRLMLSQRAQYSERENRIRQHYPGWLYLAL